MSDACHIMQCYYFSMSELLARVFLLSVGAHLRNQVGLVDTAFDIIFILVCAMWHNALLQRNRWANFVFQTTVDSYG